jgi:hypothetical protein
MPATRTRTRNQGKTSFVKEVLVDNPHANSRVVNEAWTAAGMEGTISDTLVNKMRSELGFAGNLRGRRRATGERRAYTGKKRGRKPKSFSIQGGEAQAGVTRSRARSRSGQLVELEEDFDRLLFKVMSLGDLAEVENRLRETRRLLYRDVSGQQS